MEFKRKTLIENIERVLKNVGQNELPATIKEVYAFGGILRDKKRAHDFDAVFLYNQTVEQAQIWDRFRRNFNNASDENREISRHQLHELLQAYYRQNMPLSRVVMLDSVSETLEKYGIVPKWAACFSWTDFYSSFLGMFYPELDKILRKLLFRGTRGIQTIFRNYEDFKKGNTGLVAKNFQLAWSPEEPDVAKNLIMSQHEKVAYLISEIMLFREQLAPLKEQTSKIQEELKSITKDTNLSLNFDPLNSKHVDILLDEKEPYKGLLKKCELARQELRYYREEISVLRNLLSSIVSFLQRKNDTHYPLPSEWVMSELVTLWTILHTPKYEVREARMRDILRILGLPEDYVVTIQRYGSKTDYELEPDIEKRKKLLAVAEEEKNKGKYLMPLNRVVKSFDKNFYVDVGFAEGNPISLAIGYSRWSDYENDCVRKITMLKLKKAKFNVKKDNWSVRGTKIVEIDGNLTPGELENTVRKALEKYAQS